jgi:hypothetical protein
LAQYPSSGTQDMSVHLCQTVQYTQMQTIVAISISHKYSITRSIRLIVRIISSFIFSNKSIIIEEIDLSALIDYWIIFFITTTISSITTTITTAVSTVTSIIVPTDQCYLIGRISQNQVK